MDRAVPESIARDYGQIVGYTEENSNSAVLQSAFCQPLPVIVRLFGLAKIIFTH